MADPHEKYPHRTKAIVGSILVIAMLFGAVVYLWSRFDIDVRELTTEKSD